MNLIIIKSEDCSAPFPVGTMVLWDDSRTIPWGWSEVETPSKHLDLDTPMTKFENGKPVL